jgi:hypothetical protein
LFAHTEEFAGEDAGFGAGLGGLRGIAGGAFGGLQDERASFGGEGFEVLEIAVKAAGVGAKELVAFAFLGGVLVRSGGGEVGRLTCSSGEGP